MSKNPSAASVYAGTEFISVEPIQRIEHDDVFVVAESVDIGDPETTGVSFSLRKLDDRRVTLRCDKGVVFDYNPLNYNPLSWVYVELNPAAKLLSEYYKERFPIQEQG